MSRVAGAVPKWLSRGLDPWMNPLPPACRRHLHWTAVFADKRNALNVYLVKWGWLWTCVVALWTLLVLTWNWRGRRTASRGQRMASSGQRMAWRSIVMDNALATAHWIACTQWLPIGFSIADRRPLFDRLFHHYPWAYCTSADPAHSLSFHACDRHDGHRWVSFDASGHCFLLVHSSLYLLADVVVPQYLLHVRSGGDGSKDSDRGTQDGSPKARPRISTTRLCSAVAPPLLLSIIWLVMLCATCTFYHTWTEKVVGTAAACVYWMVVV